MNLDEALPGFVAESADLLREMETGLLNCSGSTTDPETINLIFRVAHTIKGSAGLFGLDGIVEFVHVMETALDQVRLGRVSMSDEFVSVLLRCKDHVEALLVPVGPGRVSIDPELEPHGAELLADLRRAAQAGSDGANSGTLGSETGPGQAGAGQTGATPATPTEAALAGWQLCVRFGAGVLTSGMDPLGFIRYLQTF